MNNWIKLLLLSYIITTMIVGCSSEEAISSEEKTTISENVYLEQNRWIYAQMNQNYLWREDLPDSTECNYDQNPKDFFESLLSDKDRFSYLTTNESYRPKQLNLGFAYQIYKDAFGFEAWNILYLSSNQARKSGLKRGDFVRQISNDGYCIQLERVGIEAGKFFYMKNSTPIVLSLLDDNRTTNVLCDSIYNVEGRNIAYLCYLKFEDTPELYTALSKFKQSNVSDLILDLRYNPGGYVSTCKYLCNSIIPSTGYQSVFQQCSYNDIISQRYLIETGSERTFTYFSEPYPDNVATLEPNIVPLELKRVYVLTSSHTASASEAAIICLRPYIDVVVIGERTVGKNVGSWNISDKKYKYSIQPITMRYYNSLGETTPDEGLMVDYEVHDGYNINKNEIGDTQEQMLNFALSLIVPHHIYKPVYASRTTHSKFENSLTPIGDPSYVTEFNKYYNESN